MTAWLLLVGLGSGVACKAQPDPEPAGPPDLVLLVGVGADPGVLSRGLSYPTVWPVAEGWEATRESVLTGTWPGLPSRWRLQEVLTAMGYESATGTLEDLTAWHRATAATAVPRFLLVEPGEEATVSLGDPGSLEDGLALFFGSEPGTPLVLAGGAVPTHLRGRRIPDPVSALDVLPTLLDAAGTVAPAGSPGRSLWAELQDRPAPVPEHGFAVGPAGFAVHTRSWRLTWAGSTASTEQDLRALAESPIDGGQFHLFALGGEADVLGQEPEVAESLKAALVRWRVATTSDPTTRPLDPALQRTLQERGYW